MTIIMKFMLSFVIIIRQVDDGSVGTSVTWLTFPALM